MVSINTSDISNICFPYSKKHLTITESQCLTQRLLNSNVYLMYKAMPAVSCFQHRIQGLC